MHKEECYQYKISGYAGLSANTHPRSNFAFKLGKGQDENETIRIFIWKNVPSLLYAQLWTKYKDTAQREGSALLLWPTEWLNSECTSP